MNIKTYFLANMDFTKRYNENKYNVEKIYKYFIKKVFDISNLHRLIIFIKIFMPYLVAKSFFETAV